MPSVSGTIANRPLARLLRLAPLERWHRPGTVDVADRPCACTLKTENDDEGNHEHEALCPQPFRYVRVYENFL